MRRGSAFSATGAVKGQNPVLVVGLDLVDFHRLGERDGAFEAAIGELAVDELVVAGLRLALMLAADLDLIAMDLKVDLFGIHAGNRHANVEPVPLHVGLHRWHPRLFGQLPPGGAAQGAVETGKDVVEAVAKIHQVLQERIAADQLTPGHGDTSLINDDFSSAGDALKRRLGAQEWALPRRLPRAGASLDAAAKNLVTRAALHPPRRPSPDTSHALHCVAAHRSPNEGMTGSRVTQSPLY